MLRVYRKRDDLPMLTLPLVVLLFVVITGCTMAAASVMRDGWLANHAIPGFLAALPLFCLAIAAYGSLYYVERKPGYIFTALIFFAYTIDIVLLFMYEFVPEFALQFEDARNAYPMLYTTFNMAIILLYRLVLGSLLSRSFSPVEGFFLGGLHNGGLGERRFISRIGCVVARVPLYQAAGIVGDRVRYLLLGGGISMHEPLAMGFLASARARVCPGRSGNVCEFRAGEQRGLCFSSQGARRGYGALLHRGRLRLPRPSSADAQRAAGRIPCALDRPRIRADQA